MNTFNIVISIILIVLILIYLLRNKVVKALVGSLHLMFITLIILSFITLFIPQIFIWGAEKILKSTDIYANIQSVDNSLNIVNIPEQTSSIIDEVSNWFGFSQNNTDKTEDNVNKNNSTGLLESTLYPSLLSFVTLLLRGVTLIFSVGGSLLIIYVSYSVNSQDKIISLEHRIRNLENRVYQSK